jgi:branched-subunit amino acid aminotransferase/4-amino-4-deoxychorismate lyase
VVEASELTTTPQELESAQEAFVASSVREVIPVSRIEDRELLVGPVTERTARAVRERIASALAREPQS